MAKKETSKGKTMTRTQRKLRTYQIIFAVVCLIVVASMVLSAVAR